MKRFWKLALVLLGPLLLGLFLGTMTMVAYPNSLKLGAVWCPDDKPDAFVVRYNVTTSDGTGTNWTLYCMSERGETEEIGTWLPLLAVCAVPVGILYVLVFGLMLVGTIRHIARGGEPPPTDPMGTYLTPEQVLAQQGQPPPFE